AVSNILPGYNEKQLAEQSDEEIAQRQRNEQEYLSAKDEEIEQIDEEILQAYSEGNDELVSALRKKRNQSLAEQKTSELELETINREVDSDRRKELQKLQEAQQDAEKAQIEFVEGEDLFTEDPELDKLTCTAKQVREKLGKDLSAAKLPYVSPEDRFYEEHPLLAGDSDRKSSIGFVTFQHVPTGAFSAFAAFVTSFNDRYALKWNNEEVFGRMDPIPTYSGTTRTMSLNITIPSDSYAHAWRNMQNISMLIQSLYPSYDGEGRFSTTRIAASPLMKISWGNLINSPRGTRSGVLATIDSLSMTPKLEAGYFEWGSKTEKEAQKAADGQCQNSFLIPKEISIDLSFGVLHDIPLGWRNLGVVQSIDKTNRYYKFPYNIQTYQKVADGSDESLFDKHEVSKSIVGDPSQRDLRTIAKCQRQLISNNDNPNVSHRTTDYANIVANENTRIVQHCRKLLGPNRINKITNDQLMAALRAGNLDIPKAE
ncbi:hypothetical protein OAT10_05065, partial [Luminiphilus sp.]|nr:hypothetical protein [Luminiphilus sp.]